MNTLAKHIEELVTRHNCVIVPELGGFITYRESARIVGGKIYPPTKQIRFNSLLNYNDGLLCERYISSKSISYTEALETIRISVEKVKTELNANGYAKLGHLGTMRRSDNGSIWLECNDTSYIPDNYGLKPINITSPARKNSSPKTIVLELPQNTAHILRYAAAIAVISLITLLLPNHTSDTAYKAAINFDSLRNIPTVEHTINTTEPQTTDTATSPAQTATTNTIDTDKPYHMIIASLASEQQARQYLAERNDNELILISQNGKHRISAKRFATYREAVNYIDSVREEPTLRNAWILCKK